MQAPGFVLTTGSEAARAAYARGVAQLVHGRAGAVASLAEAIAHDPGLAVGHAALALAGHLLEAPVDVPLRLAAARRGAEAACPCEVSHVAAVHALVHGELAPAVAHVLAHPRDELLLAAVVPDVGLRAGSGRPGP